MSFVYQINQQHFFLLLLLLLIFSTNTIKYILLNNFKEPKPLVVCVNLSICVRICLLSVEAL